MANPNPRRENLKPARTKKEAAKRGKAGGKASGKARREKKSMQELAKIVLNMPYDATDAELDELEKTCFVEFPDKHLTVGERSLLAVAKKAMKGDASALAFIRDTAGEKPIEKLEVSGNVEVAANKIRQLIDAKKANDGGE
jgi:hypothetical protein